MIHSSQIDIDTVRNSLNGFACRFSVQAVSQTTSTNDIMMKRGASGGFDGEVLIAATQSQGRGRMQRSFFSPDGTGLYMSLLIRRPIPAQESVRMTAAAAVAVAQSIEVLSNRRTDIKWVNDIYMHDKKVCGILVEGRVSPDGLLQHAVIGIGVNLAPPPDGFPQDIATVAGAVFVSREQAVGMRERLAAEILNRLAALLEDLQAPALLEAYRSRSFLIGERITVLRGQEQKSAVALDVHGNFGLLVRYDSGEEELLNSGEVSICR